MNAADITGIATCVTKKWAKQRKAESGRPGGGTAGRNVVGSRRLHRHRPGNHRQRLCRGVEQRPLSCSATHNVASIAIREEFRERTDRELQWKYFTGKLLRKHLNLPHTENWKVTRDPRGTLIEPAHKERNWDGHPEDRPIPPRHGVGQLRDLPTWIPTSRHAGQKIVIKPCCTSKKKAFTPC